MRETVAGGGRHGAEEGAVRPGPVPALSAGQTVGDSLHQVRQRLIAVGVDPTEAALEARVLHQEILGLTVAQLYTRLDKPLAPQAEAALARLLSRRLAREPLAYLIGQREFFGLKLRIDRRALIPRPETEILVEAALDMVARLKLPEPWIVDVGTGSGAIAIALAVQLPQARVVALDRSLDALALAAENVRQHGLEDQIALVAGDLLAPLQGPFDLIVANLPYVPDAAIATLAPEVRDFEPSLALAGGPDGLNLYRRLLPQVASRLKRPGALLIEIGQGQGASAHRLVQTALPDAAVRSIPDYAGIERVVSAALVV